MQVLKIHLILRDQQQYGCVCVCVCIDDYSNNSW